MENRIINFGKYKGQPVEVLATDKNYVDWLMAQPWFREKYVNVYNVVINNFKEPTNTPEHNRLQVKFLSLEYRKKLVYLIDPKLFERDSNWINTRVQTELGNLSNEQRTQLLEGLLENRTDHYNKRKSWDLIGSEDPVFEPVDVCFDLSYGIAFSSKISGYVDWNRYGKYKVEIKPTIGDDFPSVLRQLKASMPVEKYPSQRIFNVLLVGEYSGTGASREEFIRFFESQGYRVVFENELERVDVSNICQEYQPSEQITMALENSRNSSPPKSASDCQLRIGMRKNRFSLNISEQNLPDSDQSI